MAEKFWTHLKLKNGDKVKFIPPAPDGDQLGGITQAQRESLTKLQGDIAQQGNRIEQLEKRPSGGGSGTVKSVNGVQPNAAGDVLLTDATLPAAALDVEARNGIAELTDSLDKNVYIRKVINSFDDVTIAYPQAYMNGNGGAVSNPSWKITDYIAVTPGDTFAYALRGYENLVTIIAVFNANKVVIDKVTGASTQMTGEYTVPNGAAFVKFCANNNSNDTISSNGRPAAITPIPTVIAQVQSDVEKNNKAIMEVESKTDMVAEIEKFYVHTVNLIDKHEFEPSPATGAGYYYSGYVPVIPGDLYDLSVTGVSIYQVVFYGAEKNKLSDITVNGGSKEFTAIDGAAYVRLLYKFSETDDIMLTHGICGDYVPFGIVPIANDETPPYIERDTTNLINDRKYARSIYIDSNGNAAQSSGCRAYEYVPVVTGVSYAFSGTNGAWVYDSGRKPLRKITSPYTAQQGDAYVRVSIAKSSTAPYLGVVDPNGFKRDEPFDTFRLKNCHPDTTASSLYGKIWNAMGDSITEGSGTTKSYMTFIKERTGINVRSYGMSNTAVAQRGSTAVYQNDMYLRYATMDDNADYITIFGGTNDHGNRIPIGEWGDTDGTTVYGAMKILCEGLITKYTGKKIGFILPLPKVNAVAGGNDFADYSYPEQTFTAYVECIKDVCKRYSIPVLDLYTGSGLAPKIEAVRTAMMPDGLHPNATGHEMISWKIQRFLESL